MKRELVDRAVRHLRRSDEVMRAMIDDVGPFTLRLKRDRFAMLVSSIISQQISTQAARTIRARLVERVAPSGLTPGSVSRLGVDELRRVGLSQKKAEYVLDLATHVSDGRIQLRTIGRRCDEQIIQDLTRVRGIGTWTAQMFLIFSLGRPNVFPADDLGIRSAIRNRYELDALPSKQLGHEIAASWQPFTSIGSWYCWRSLEVDSAK